MFSKSSITPRDQPLAQTRVRLKLLWLLLIVTTIVGACQSLLPYPGDAFFDLTVVNRSNRRVEVFTDGMRRGLRDVPLPACSQYDFGPGSYQPNGSVRIEIRDLQQTLVISTTETPVSEKPGARRKVVVVVPPSAAEECADITIIPTPTPPTFSK